MILGRINKANQREKSGSCQRLLSDGYAGSVLVDRVLGTQRVFSAVHLSVR